MMSSMTRSLCLYFMCDIVDAEQSLSALISYVSVHWQTNEQVNSRKLTMTLG